MLWPDENKKKKRQTLRNAEISVPPQKQPLVLWHVSVTPVYNNAKESVKKVFISIKKVRKP